MFYVIFFMLIIALSKDSRSDSDAYADSLGPVHLSLSKEEQHKARKLLRKEREDNWQRYKLMRKEMEEEKERAEKKEKQEQRLKIFRSFVRLFS